MISKEEFERRKAIEYAFYYDNKRIEASKQGRCEWYECSEPIFKWKAWNYRIKEEPVDELEEMINDEYTQSRINLAVLKRIKALESLQDTK